MDMEDALRHALSLIDEESERLVNEPDHCEEWKWANDAANDILSKLLDLTRGGPADA